jgi:hypothetical protein
MLNRSKITENINKFFEKIDPKPDKFDVLELTIVIESIIPVHVDLEVSSYDEVDTLLAVYPYLYQRLVRTYSYFCQQVRVNAKNKTAATKMRIYRDALEELLKTIRMQYESLSRRITVFQDRRG